MPRPRRRKRSFRQSARPTQPSCVRAWSCPNRSSDQAQHLAATDVEVDAVHSACYSGVASEQPVAKRAALAKIRLQPPERHEGRCQQRVRSCLQRQRRLLHHVARAWVVCVASREMSACINELRLGFSADVLGVGAACRNLHPLGSADRLGTLPGIAGPVALGATATGPRPGAPACRDGADDRIPRTRPRIQPGVPRT